jgi:hypothetical protein
MRDAVTDLMAQPQPRDGYDRGRQVTFLLIALAAGAAFGAGDQYLGSIARWPMATAFSLMSAPWLLLPFCFGCTQVRGRMAGLIGLTVTLAALAGYCAMTLSPIENVHLSQDPGLIFSLIRSEERVLLGGLIAGPIYGLLGQRWRTRRSWVSALLLGGAVLLEPIARVLHLEYGPPLAYIAELTAGALAVAYFLTAFSRSNRGLARPSG